MGKFISRFMIILLVAAVSTYVGVYWKVNRAVDQAFSQMQPFANASHQGVTIDLQGRIAVNDIRTYIPSLGLSFQIGSVGFATSNLWETLQLEETLSSFKLPREARLDVVGLRFELSPSLLKMTDTGDGRDRLAQMSFLGCGKTRHSTLRQLSAMGYDELVGDFAMGYQFNEHSGELTTNMSVSADNVMRLEFTGLEKNAFGFINDFRNFGSLFQENAAPGKITTKVSDLGYNQRFASYCADQADMPAEEWLVLHTELFMQALDRFEIEVNDELKQAYPVSISPGSEVVISIQPRKGAVFEDMGWYEAKEVPGLLGLSVSINGKNIPVKRLGWNPAKWSDASLATDGGESAKQRGQQPTVERQLEVPEKRSYDKPEFTEVPLATLRDYLQYKVRLRRTDAKVFEGLLTKVDNSRCWLEIHSGGGIAAVPINIRDVDIAMVFK